MVFECCCGAGCCHTTARCTSLHLRYGHHLFTFPFRTSHHRDACCWSIVNAMMIWVAIWTGISWSEYSVDHESNIGVDFSVGSDSAVNFSNSSWRRVRRLDEYHRVLWSTKCRQVWMSKHRAFPMDRWPTLFSMGLFEHETMLVLPFVMQTYLTIGLLYCVLNEINGLLCS